VWKQIDDHSGGDGKKDGLQNESSPEYAVAGSMKKGDAKRVDATARNAQRGNQYRNANGEQCSFHP
jgi:hypothetical protein